MMELLEFLLHIKRFPSVEIWIDEKGRYHALCCPSFEHYGRKRGAYAE